MRLRRFLCLLLVVAVLSCGFFTIFACAVDGAHYFYNDVEYPNIMDLDEYSSYNYWFIVKYSDNSIYLQCANELYALRDSAGNYNAYYDNTSFRFFLQDGEWVKNSSSFSSSCACSKITWSSHDILFENSTVAVSGSDIYVVEPPPPPNPVEEFFLSVGQILTSATAWISSFTGFIMDHPLVLFAALLGVCGIGIGLIERLRKQRR